MGSASQTERRALAVGGAVRAALRGGRRAARRGLTLIELMVVMGIIAIMIGIGALGIASIRAADVSATADTLAGAMRYVYTLAVHQNRTYRIVIDMDERRFYTEVAKTDDPCARYIPNANSEEDEKSRDAEKAAAAAEAAGEGDETSDGSAFAVDDSELLAEEFRPETNVTAVITEHHEEPQVGGKAVIYFYPSGRAERAMVWVGEQDEVDGEAQFVPQVTLELEALGRVSRSGEVLDWKDFLKEQK
ncbi:MAG: prepilin-type N-terminal cleavage/methylation domain-containing protein [Myxococcales bacterium]|nr:prepilin-type N-terminal cleavage/methylation domain-containing protein [Myxococcales bacterium]MCB9731590.1 prepilin-type N-terminal cleavage/methylation domain-containing protein [Deltaproteobacteria bacterium]